MTIAHEPPHPPPLPVPGQVDRGPRWGWLSTLWCSRHLSVPLLLPAGMLVAAYVIRVKQAAHDAVAAEVVLVVAFAFFARHKWDRAAEVAYAIGSAALLGGWVCWVGSGGVHHWALPALAVLALAWGIPWCTHKRPRARIGDALLVAEWDAWWQHYAAGWGLAGSKVVEVARQGVMETLTVQLIRGRQHARDAEQIQHLIESALDGYVRHGMLRVRVNPQNGAQAFISLRRENPLTKPVEWDQSLVPASITQPAPIGVSESGEVVRTILLVNWFIIGRSRSGKSNELSELLATITGCADARTWLIDRKGGRAARPWLPAVDWVAVSIEEIRLMLQVADAEVRARAMHAYNGEEQLRPTAEVPAIFLVVDEAGEVTGLNGEEWCARTLASIASMGMGVAVYVVVLTQYGALEESVRTEQTRSNLICRMCFQVEKAEHGQFALSDFAKLDASKLEHPGEFYWKRGPRVPSEPARGHEMAHGLVSAIATRNGKVTRRPLLLYASDHQETYDTRWSRLPEVFVPLAPQAQGVTRAPLPQQAQEAPMDTTADTTALAAGYGEIRADAEARAQRIEDELAAAHPSGATEPPQVDDAALRRKIGWQKRQFAHLLQSAPEDGVSPAELMEQTGLSRSFVQTQLRSLTSDGALLKIGKGAYRAAPDTGIWEAMEKIREGDRLLLEDARSA